MKKILNLTVLLIFILTAAACIPVQESGSDQSDSISQPESIKITYLKEKEEEFKKIEDELCSKSYYELTNEHETSTEERLNSEIYKAELAEILGNKDYTQLLIDDSKELMDKTKDNELAIYEFSTVCKTKNKIYVVLPTSDFMPKIALWSKEEGFKIFEGTFSEGIKVNFFPEVLYGKSLFYAVEGDPELYSWTFYLLDEATMQIGIVEKCEATEETLSCNLEYKP